MNPSQEVSHTGALYAFALSAALALALPSSATPPSETERGAGQPPAARAAAHAEGLREADGPPDFRKPTILPGVTAAPELEGLLKAANPNAAVQPGAYYFKTVPGVAFHGKDASPSYVYTIGGCVYNTSATWQLVAGVDLPDAAVVKAIYLSYYRTGALASTGYLTRFETDAMTAVDLTSVSATMTGGAGLNSSPGFTEVVDNYHYGYVAIWAGAPSPSNQLCGIRVQYQMPASGTFSPVTPCRVFDTRSSDPPNLTTSARAFQITGKCGVPAGATAVVGNFTVDQATAAGYIAFWQFGISWPLNSTLNYGAGQIVANSAVVPLDSTGQFQGRCYAGTVGVLFDVTGYYY